MVGYDVIFITLIITWFLVIFNQWATQNCMRNNKYYYESYKRYDSLLFTFYILVHIFDRSGYFEYIDS
jgi:hypothetical protein